VSDAPLIEKAIRVLVEHPTPQKLSRVYELLLTTKVWIVTDGTAREDKEGRIRFQAACVRLSGGGSALPIFTSRDHLARWKSEAVPTVALPGKTAFALADSMAVAAIVINHKSEYKGRIDREDVKRLAAGDATAV